jgi:hypothetical protein
VADVDVGAIEEEGVRNMRWWYAVGLLGCGDNSLGDISGPHEARVGETVQITSEGTLRAPVDDVTMLSLIGYDGHEVLDELKITAVELDGGTELPDLAEPASDAEEGILVSNQVAIRHDRRAVDYRATAEITCLAEGVVESLERPKVVFGLEWDYDDGESAGLLNRKVPDFAFACVP